MRAQLALLTVLVVAALAAGDAHPRLAGPELSFTVGAGLTDYAAICVGEAPGLRQARRMTDLAAYRSARWSPDGSLLAVDVWRPRDNAIRLFRADGSPAGRATQPLSHEQDFHPTWSPDGNTLAFEREGGDGRSGIWVTSGGAERQISRTHAYALDWSPIGDLIAIDVGGEFDNEVELIRPTGALVRRIEVPRVAPFEDGVSWSPDGTRLALGGGVIVDRNGNRVGRYAAPSGTPSETTYPARMPAWSPDGAYVAYERAPSWTDARTNVRVLGHADLYLGSPTETELTRLTNTADLGEGAPAWRRAAAPAGNAERCARYGSARRDVIRGTGGDDLILAGSGSDLVYAGAGDDHVVGGKGNDAIVGGPGRDALSGDSGNDGFNTRDRTRDYVTGGWGRDRAFADAPRLDVVLGVERVTRR